MIPRFDIKKMAVAFKQNLKSIPFEYLSTPMIANIIRPPEQHYKCNIILPSEAWESLIDTETEFGIDFGMIVKSQVNYDDDMIIEFIFTESELPIFLQEYLHTYESTFDSLDQYITIYHPKICDYVEKKILE